MSLIILLFVLLLLVFLIVNKLNPMLALLVAAIIAGIGFGLPVGKIINSINTGIGSTLGSTVMVLALGAMIGKLAEESGAAQKLVLVLTQWFGVKNIQWAVLCTGLLAGIPLFYNAGFVVLIPLVFALARTTGLPQLYVGLPMAASLSVTHGFLLPHPGPVALAALFKAGVAKTFLYGFVLAVPIAVVAGVLFARLIAKKQTPSAVPINTPATTEKLLPSFVRAFFIILSPVVFIAVGTLGASLVQGNMAPVFLFLQEPAFALLLSLALTIVLTKFSMGEAMAHSVEGVKSIATIFLIIAAGGAFKQVLVESRIGEDIKMYTSGWQLSPLVLGWLVAALFRVALGSATVAALTAAGIVAPLLTPGVSPELMVLSVGAGSLFCSHLNDTGFWMFKEYFGLTVKQTFETWTVMETLISVLGLAGVLVLNKLV